MGQSDRGQRETRDLQVDRCGGRSAARLRTRDRAIRRYCGELLGLCADPARIVSDQAAAICRSMKKVALPASGADARQRLECIRDLITTRSAMAEVNDLEQLESKTDELLLRLDQMDAVVGERTGTF